MTCGIGQLNKMCLTCPNILKMGIQTGAMKVELEHWVPCFFSLSGSGCWAGLCRQLTYNHTTRG